MEQGKDSITLNQVRAIMEMLAQKHGRPVVAIEISQVQNEIGRGSNGTIGAFVKTVRQEYIHAKNYDRSNISPHLKSAIMEEIDRFADNARENTAEELEAISSLNDELREKIDQADDTIRDLEETIRTQHTDAEKEARRLNDALVQAKAKIDADKEVIDQQKAELAAHRDELTKKNTEAISLNWQIGTLEADKKSAVAAASGARDELAQAISSLHEAKTKASLAEQATAHQQQTIELLTGQVGKLEEQIGEMKARISELTDQSDQLHQKLEDANQSRIKALEMNQRQDDVEINEETDPDSGDEPHRTRNKRGKAS